MAPFSLLRQPPLFIIGLEKLRFGPQNSMLLYILEIQNPENLLDSESFTLDKV